MIEIQGKTYVRWTDKTGLYPQCGRLEDHPPLRSAFEAYADRLNRRGGVVAPPFGSSDQ